MLHNGYIKLDTLFSTFQPFNLSTFQLFNLLSFLPRVKKIYFFDSFLHIFLQKRYRIQK